MSIRKLQKLVGMASLQNTREVSLRANTKEVEPPTLYEPSSFDNLTLDSFYTLLNIQLDSVDFVPLEKFHSFAHKKARLFGFKVVDSYAVPPTKTLLKLDKPKESKQIKEIVIPTYHRFLRLSKVLTLRLPLFVHFMQIHAPAGVKMTIREYKDSDDEIRYIPDDILESRKAELLSLDDPKTRKLLGWE
ncbi:unnamed protein product [Thelazia callipaeda]|uniref:Ribosomal_S10 domain-containing protein n=1 Tax=Thelazia callipaeda TaxID=103827 RepID=A0A0N5CSI8_THECL|nr:unnamed protein product [Thelazia callipaeda]